MGTQSSQNRTSTTLSTLGLELSVRERIILRSVVQNYIMTAAPVGSRTLTRKYNLGLSPATIRNTMSDLEDLGLLTHPHTSAGRFPTDLGYRVYVDDLMQIEGLPDEIRHTIQNKLASMSIEANDVMAKVSELLAEVTSLLTVILAPDLSTGILEKVALVRLAVGRIMVIVVINSGLVRNIQLEMDSDITDEQIASATQVINQRLGGLRLAEIPQHITARLANEGQRNSIVRMFLDFPDKIFSGSQRESTFIGGRGNVLSQPEYSSPENLQGIIELMEDNDIFVHLLKDRATQKGISVTIGNENKDDQLKQMSVVASTYRIGDVFGSIGIIGPTRMNYARLVALVDYTSKMVGKRVSKTIK